jgi:hypothetical protein
MEKLLGKLALGILTISLLAAIYLHIYFAWQAFTQGNIFLIIGNTAIAASTAYAMVAVDDAKLKRTFGDF